MIRIAIELQITPIERNKSLIKPNHFVATIIDVDERATYADAIETCLKQCIKNYMPLLGVPATDVHGSAETVHGVAGTVLILFPLNGTECGVYPERDASEVAGGLESVHERGVHVRKGTGGRRPPELFLVEVRPFTHSSLLLPWPSSVRT